jgi:hypothetical protein
LDATTRCLDCTFRNSLFSEINETYASTVPTRHLSVLYNDPYN